MGITNTKQYYETGKDRYGVVSGAPIDWLDSFKEFKQGNKDRNIFPNWQPIKAK